MTLKQILRFWRFILKVVRGLGKQSSGLFAEQPAEPCSPTQLPDVEGLGEITAKDFCTWITLLKHAEPLAAYDTKSGHSPKNHCGCPLHPCHVLRDLLPLPTPVLYLNNYKIMTKAKTFHLPNISILASNFNAAISLLSPSLPPSFPLSILSVFPFDTLSRGN